jgi:tetratricopeptide (TPR) repeat protein
VQQGYKLADQARDTFRAGNFTAASAQIQQAIAKIPGDPVLHEFAALCLFAMKDYHSAAAVLNNLMAVAPGMDWTTMSSLYPSTNVYEQQLSDLDRFCQTHPDDSAAHFVLAYHRLVCGDAEAAVAALQVVVAQQPKDMVAQRMLQALAGGGQSAAESAGPAAATPTPDSIAAAGPTTDLIGPWRAQRDKATFELELDEDGGFAWKSGAEGQEPIRMAGTYTLAGDLLVLESPDQGAMIGRASPQDADHFRFVPVDSPSSDQGLSFGRVLKR